MEPMAGERDFFAALVSNLDDPASNQHQPPQAFDSLSFRDTVFEDAEFWPLQEGFFDIPGIASVLPISDTLPPLRSLDATAQSYVSLESHSVRVQDVAHPSDVEDVGQNALAQNLEPA
jgi:hypothetical protein